MTELQASQGSWALMARPARRVPGAERVDEHVGAGDVTGAGTTRLATALGYKVVEPDFRVYYSTAADLVARSNKAASKCAGPTRCASGAARSL